MEVHERVVYTAIFYLAKSTQYQYNTQTLLIASTANSACSLFCALWTNSLPTFMRGRKKAFVKSTNGKPNKWHNFCETVSKKIFNIKKMRKFQQKKNAAFSLLLTLLHNSRSEIYSVISLYIL